MLITTLALHRRLSILRYVTHFICSRNLAIHKFTHQASSSALLSLPFSPFDLTA